MNFYVDEFRCVGEPTPVDMIAHRTYRTHTDPIPQIEPHDHLEKSLTLEMSEGKDRVQGYIWSDNPRDCLLSIFNTNNFHNDAEYVDQYSGNPFLPFSETRLPLKLALLLLLSRLLRL